MLNINHQRFLCRKEVVDVALPVSVIGNADGADRGLTSLCPTLGKRNNCVGSWPAVFQAALVNHLSFIFLRLCRTMLDQAEIERTA